MVHIYFSHQFSSAWDSFIFKKEFLSPHFHQLVLMKLLSCFNQKVPWDSTCYIEHHINLKKSFLISMGYSWWNKGYNNNNKQDKAELNFVQFLQSK